MISNISWAPAIRASPVTAASAADSSQFSMASAKARRASEIQDAYKVEGVPALGIAGRWYTDSTLASTGARSLQVADYLIAEARKPR